MHVIVVVNLCNSHALVAMDIVPMVNVLIDTNILCHPMTVHRVHYLCMCVLRIVRYSFTKSQRICWEFLLVKLKIFTM